MVAAGIDALKSEISAEWLGRKGVCAVGVERDGTDDVVVIGLDSDDPATIRMLEKRYAKRPVRVRPNVGPIYPQ
jgi:hypothetical protein